MNQPRAITPQESAQQIAEQITRLAPADRVKVQEIVRQLAGILENGGRPAVYAICLVNAQIAAGAFQVQ